MENRLVVLSGLPASGKTTLAGQFKKKGYSIVSDKTSYEEINKEGKDNYKESFQNIKELLSMGKNVLYDAPNITYRKRHALLNEIKDIDCKKTCIVVAVPYEECIKRNQKRKDGIPYTMLHEMYQSWETPYFYEGWDKINISLGKYKGTYGSPEDFVKQVIDFDQEKENHSRTLGDHCLETAKNIDSTSSTLKAAGMLHDCGKVLTKTKKGQKTSYPKHQNVGAYNAMFYDIKNPLKVSILVNLHLIPFSWENDKSRGEIIQQHYRRKWKRPLYANVMKLHEADVKAH